jgi:hypothetical protein
VCQFTSSTSKVEGIGLTGLQIHVVTPVQIFYEPQAVAGLVIPGTRASRPILERADCLVPQPRVLETGSFERIATWESKEFLHHCS